MRIALCRLAACLMLSAALVGCEGALTNSATVYPPVSGLLEVRWRLSTPGVQQVDYAVDGTSVGRSSNAETRFAVQLDTTKLENGVHTLTVTAQNAEGQPLRVIQHTLLVQN